MMGDHELRLAAEDCDTAGMSGEDWEIVTGSVRRTAGIESRRGRPDAPWLMLSLMIRTGPWGTCTLQSRLEGGDLRQSAQVQAVMRTFRARYDGRMRAVVTDMSDFSGYDDGMRGVSDGELTARSAAMSAERFIELFSLQPDISLWRLPGDGDGPAGAGHDMRAFLDMREELEVAQLAARAPRMHGEGFALRVRGVNRRYENVRKVWWVGKEDLLRRSGEAILAAVTRQDPHDAGDPGGNVAYDLYAGAMEGFRTVTRKEMLGRMAELRKTGPGDGPDGRKEQ